MAKPCVGVDRAFLGHQVAHVAVGGQDGEVLAEVLVDRLGLGGRLDDEEVLGHGGSGSGGPGLGEERRTAAEKATPGAGGHGR